VKLLDVFLLYPAFALLIIGLHQVITRSIAEGSFATGFAQSYWILMLALLLLFTYQWRKSRRQITTTRKNTPPPSSRKRKKE